jgi:DNA repair protein RadC
MAATEGAFLARLAALPDAPRALAAFDRLFAAPPPLAPYPFPTLLYHALVTHLLDWLGLAMSPAGLRWEWRPLYSLAAETDPFYFTPEQITRKLADCPPLAPEPWAVLRDTLARYFDLWRGGLLDGPPRSPLVSERLLHAWQALFPPRFAWRAPEVLKSVGLYPVGSAGGYRAWLRFAQGRFQPELTAEALRRWQAACWGADSGTAPDLAPHRADFLASAFAGELTALGLPGPCGEAPRCEACPLRSECRWAAAPPSGAAHPAEAAALARRGDAAALTLEQLLAGVLNLPAAEADGLRERLEGASLRALAGMSLADLGDRLGPAGARPERLLLLFELARRFGEERLAAGASFPTAWDLFKHFRVRLRDLKQEQIIVVLLDVKKRYLADRVITQGGLDSSPAHPREIFAAAVRERAGSVLLVHNHPSGDPTPSKQDLEVTRQLVASGRLLGIPLLDHVIIADDKYTSLLEAGLVEF